MAVIWVVPTWLSFLDAQNSKKEKEHQGYPKLDSWVFQNAKMITVVSLIICGTIFYMSKDIQSNSHLLEMYHQDHPTYEVIHLAEEELGGVIPVFINIEHPNNQSLEIEHLQKIRKLYEVIDQEEVVL